MKWHRRWLKKLFSGRQPEDSLVTLIEVAAETPAIREQLILVLNQPPQQRSMLVQKWVRELKQEQAPTLLVDTLSMLDDEQRAQQALLVLNRLQGNR